VCNGNLAGLVAVTGYQCNNIFRSCDGIELWAALIIGILGGLMYMAVERILIYYRIDDPVDAIPIHGVRSIL
jgi:Amt family ammonium transporter